MRGGHPIFSGAQQVPHWPGCGRREASIIEPSIRRSPAERQGAGQSALPDTDWLGSMSWRAEDWPMSSGFLIGRWELQIASSPPGLRSTRQRLSGLPLLLRGMSPLLRDRAQRRRHLSSQHRGTHSRRLALEIYYQLNWRASGCVTLRTFQCPRHQVRHPSYSP